MSAKTFKLAVLFADISGGVAAPGADWADQHVKILQVLSQSFRGRVISVDALQIMACFPDVDDACQAAIAIQCKLDDEMGHGARIGIHTGLCLVQGSSIFGEVVDQAESLMARAKTGQIVFSEPVMEDANGNTTRNAEALENYQGHALYSMPWRSDVAEQIAPSVEPPVEPLASLEDIVPARESAAAASPVREEPQQHATVAPITSTVPVPQESAAAVHTTADHPATQLPVLMLYGADRDFEILPGGAAFTIGRDADLCDWVVDKAVVSRVHLAIECRDGQFILQDKSTNGTYVSLVGRREYHLHNGELTLRDSGVISLSVAARSDPDLMIRFDVFSA